MTTKKKAQSPDPEIVSELRELLQPEKISHESARNGSILLAGLEDKKLYAIFKKVCLDKSGNFYAIIKETFGNEFQEGFDDKSLTDALRRLSLVGESLAVKIRNSKAKKAKKPKIERSYSRGKKSRKEYGLRTKNGGVGKLAKRSTGDAIHLPYS